MTRDELARNDGKEGRKAFVAVSGTVYDVTQSERWADGQHEGQHQAGCDLTQELKSAPHVRAVVERFPVVGSLEEPQPEAKGGSGKWFAVGAILIVLILALLILK